MAGDACECVLRGHFEEGDEECLAIFEFEHGDGRLLCSRPDGHDGPHAACGTNEHPAHVWVVEQSAEAEVATDGGVDMTQWYDLTGFRRDILRVIRSIEKTDLETYGLAIKRELEDRYGKKVNHGRLYPNLNVLVDRGLIEKSELDKRTNEYALTETGHALLAAATLDDQDLYSSQTLQDDSRTMAEQEADD